MTLPNASENPESKFILDRVERFLRDHIILKGDDDYVALTVWLAYSHAVSEFDFSPRLAITSPEKRCGKSLLLEIISYLVPKARLASSISAPALFRITEKEPETVLLLDEADAIFGRYGNKENNEPLRSLLNSGFKRGQVVTRCEPPTFQPKDFQVFCPVVLAGIGTQAIPETVGDRSVIIEMRRKYPFETIQEFESDEVDELFTPLRILLSQAVGIHKSKLRTLRPIMPTELNPRARDVWKPLYKVAQALETHLPDKVWTGRVIEASLALSAKEADIDDVSLPLRCLREIRQVFVGERMTSKDLVWALNGLEESPWGDTVRLTTHLLARFLRNYKIYPHAFGGGSVRGYYLKDFDQAWALYDQSPTPV